ncbi:MAG: TetR/AcrR family transcriptional regulator [Acidimicrobiales bacterium]
MARADTKRAPAGRRQQRRTQYQELGRSQLLDAAEEVFGRRGFNDATLKEIAELAEFSVGSVYSFFTSKEDLYLSVFTRRGEAFLPRLAAVVTSELPPLERLHALVDFEVEFFRSHPHFGRLWLRSGRVGLPPSSDRAVDETLGENLASAMTLQARLLADGQAAGVIRPGDPEVLARVLSGMIAAYQSLDPAVVEVDGGRGERLALADLHDMVERAFAPAG